MGCQHCVRSEQCCGGKGCEDSMGGLQQLALAQGESWPTCLTEHAAELNQSQVVLKKTIAVFLLLRQG